MDELKLKLMCSYGGKIHQRPHDRKLSYVGGHTKILTIDRHITFSNLLAKLHDLCEYNSEIRLKYMLPGQDLDALVSVFDDDDVKNMLFEYDLLRQISTASARLRLFVFHPVVVTTPVKARSENPDFLFGFDKEYSLYEIKDTVVSPPGNVDYVGLADGAPKQIQEIPAQIPDNNMVIQGNYVYSAARVHQSPIGRLGRSNWEQPVVYGLIPGGNREQPVVYRFIPVMPSAGKEIQNIPMSGGPVRYDATVGVVRPTAVMTATCKCNGESKGAPGRARQDVELM